MYYSKAKQKSIDSLSGWAHDTANATVKYVYKGDSAKLSIEVPVTPTNKKSIMDKI